MEPHQTLPPVLLAAGFPAELMALTCQPCGDVRQEEAADARGGGAGASMGARPGKAAERPGGCGCSARARGGCSGEAQAEAQRLVAGLRRGDGPGWAHELPGTVMKKYGPVLDRESLSLRCCGLS